MKKLFSEIKKSCITKSQRRAYNNLVKSFAQPRNIREAVEKSKLDLNVIEDETDQAIVEYKGVRLCIDLGPDMYLVLVSKMGKDQDYMLGIGNSAVVNVKDLDACIKALAK